MRLSNQNWPWLVVACCREFEDLAVGVMNVCYLQDEQRAQELLVREMDNWGGVTCIMIAVQADNKRFVSHMACQTLLNNVWMGKMSQDNGLLKVAVCLFVSFLSCHLSIFMYKWSRYSQMATNGPCYCLLCVNERRAIYPV